MIIEFELTDSITPGFKKLGISQRVNGSVMMGFGINLSPEEVQELVRTIFQNVTLDEYSKIIKKHLDDLHYEQQFCRDPEIHGCGLPRRREEVDQK